MLESPDLTPAFAAGLLALLWTLEGLAPMFEGRGSLRERLRHAGPNLALGLINAGVVAVGFAAASLWATELARNTGFGLLNLIAWPWWAEWTLAILALDLWLYLWHIACHKVPLLWRMHAVHHSDAEVDVTTAMRFHTGEIVLTCAAKLAALPLLGMTAPQLLLYEVILLPVTLFHHSNIRISARADRALRAIIVTPWMHWVHHSRSQPETDSNFASIFSFWDRLFGSFKLCEHPTSLSLGLDGHDGARAGTLRGLLMTPIRFPASGAADSKDGTDFQPATPTGAASVPPADRGTPLVCHRMRDPDIAGAPRERGRRQPLKPAWE